MRKFNGVFINGVWVEIRPSMFKSNICTVCDNRRHHTQIKEIDGKMVCNWCENEKGGE